MFGRYALRDRILKMDPQRDHQQIVYLVSSFESPWLGIAALEYSLFRTYAVPSISRLLAATGEFEKHPQRRYDDTALIIAEITEHGYDSERGLAAIRRMNRIHGRFDISNEDYLYVLSTFIYEPVRFNDRFGWRPLTEVEQEAGYHFWAAVGKRMGIRDIPPTRAAFRQFNETYEREHFRYSEDNQRVGEATIRLFLGRYPAPLRPLLRQAMYAVMDAPLRRAFGFPDPWPGMGLLVTAAMRTRAAVLRYLLPPRRKPWHFTEQPNRSYPQGYEIERLGPEDVPPDPPRRTT